MEAVTAQVRALTEELGILKAELVQVKSVHANLHQQAVEAGAQNRSMFADQAGRIEAATKRIDEIASGAEEIGGKGAFHPKPLIEAKQVEVTTFAGAVTDDRTKFLDWVEKAKDRIGLYDLNLVTALEAVEGQPLPITAERSAELGVKDRANKEIQGFLKVHTSGTASALVRGNKSGIALESWRLLYGQFNPRTLSATMNAQYLERHPKGATKIAELPGCLLTWEKNLQRGISEGRTPPNDETKRLALLRMLPKQQREKVWEVANKLYPTFADLMAKVQEMIRDMRIAARV